MHGIIGGLFERLTMWLYETPGGGSGGGGEPSGGEGTGEGGGTATAPVIDVDAMNARFDALTQGLEAITERLPQPQTPEAPDPLAELDLSGLIGGEPAGGAGDGGIDEDSAREVLGELFSRAQQSTEQRLMENVVGPLLQRLEAQETRSVALAVEERNPELATPEGAKAALEATAELVGQLGLPQEVAMRLASQPLLAEVVYRASRAADVAAGEVPAGGAEGQPQLEGGGGAPRPTGDEENPATRIVNAGRGTSAGWW